VNLHPSLILAITSVLVVREGKG